MTLDLVAISLKYLLSSPRHLSKYVNPPCEGDPIPDYICLNPKFYPYLKDAIGAIDSTHFHAHAHAAAANHDTLHDCNGELTTNTLAACDFQMCFLHNESGWEGSVADSQMLHDAHFMDFCIPIDKYYLANAGFLACDVLLVPYRGVQYHLAEWGCANPR